MGTEFASRSMTYPLGRITSFSLQQNFLKLLQFFPENLQLKQYNMNRIRLSAVNFVTNNWSKPFKNGNVFYRISFKCICVKISRLYIKLFYKLFTRATESGRSIGGCNFRNILAIKVPKCHGGKIYVFCQENSNFLRNPLSGIWSLPFHYGYCWNHEKSHSRKTQSQRNLYHSWRVSKNGKSWDLPYKWRIWSCILSYGPGTLFR